MPVMTQEQLLQQPDLSPNDSDNSPGASPVASKSDKTKAAVAGLANVIPFSNQAGAGITAAYQKLFPQGMGGAPSDATLSELYEMARRNQSDNTEQAKNNNPGTYYATNIAGSIPMYAAGAGEGAALLKSTPILGKILGAGAVGAGQGASQSNSDTVGGIAKDAAVSGALAAGGEGVAQTVGAGLGAAVKKGNDFEYAKDLKKMFADSKIKSAAVEDAKDIGDTDFIKMVKTNKPSHTSDSVLDSIKQSVLGRLATTGIAGAAGGIVGNQFDSPGTGAVVGSLIGAAGGDTAANLLALGAKGAAGARSMIPSSVANASRTVAEGAFPTIGTKASGYLNPPQTPEEDNLDRINSYLNQTQAGHADQINP